MRHEKSTWDPSSSEQQSGPERCRRVGARMAFRGMCRYLQPKKGSRLWLTEWNGMTLSTSLLYPLCLSAFTAVPVPPASVRTPSTIEVIVRPDLALVASMALEAKKKGLAMITRYSAATPAFGEKGRSPSSKAGVDSPSCRSMVTSDEVGVLSVTSSWISSRLPRFRWAVTDPWK